MSFDGMESLHCNGCHTPTCVTRVASISAMYLRFPAHASRAQTGFKARQDFELHGSNLRRKFPRETALAVYQLFNNCHYGLQSADRHACEANQRSLVSAAFYRVVESIQRWSVGWL